MPVSKVKKKRKTKTKKQKETKIYAMDMLITTGPAAIYPG